MSSEVKISVVTPMHNAEMFLRPCIDSIINQTFEDFEVVCVDDGSEDNTDSIIKEYMQRDKRVKLIRQEKSNAGAARNTGLRAAKGEYIIFLDSDDLFEPELLRLTYEKAKEKDADVVLFDGRTYITATGEYVDVNHYLKRNMIPEKEPFNRKDFPETDLLYITNPAPWTKMFKRAFIEKKGLEYPNLKNSEDVYFNFAAVCSAERIATVKENLINYRINRAGSVESSTNTDPCCFVAAYEKLYEKLVEWGIYDEVKSGFICNFLSSGVRAFNTFRDNDLKKQVAYGMKASMLGTTDALDMPPEYYKNKDDYYLVRSLLKGVDWSEKRKAKKADIEVIGNGDKAAKVSVIIPVYNVEEYLKECLDSVINQTLKDIEIICVNDGSKDNSLSILKEYADKDARIVIVNKTNGGLSSARNAGIDVAKGEYLYYLDSDDYLELDAMQVLYDRCTKDDLDIIFFDAVSFITDQSESFGNDMAGYVKKHEYSDVVTGIEYMIETEKNKDYGESACFQMIKREYLNEHKFRFYEGILHEDNLYTFTVSLLAKRVSHIARTLYYRRMHEGSIVTTISFNHCYGYFVSYCEMMKLLENTPDISGETELLYDIACRTLWAARDRYCRIPDDEKYYFIFLSKKEYYRFDTDVFVPARDSQRFEFFKENYLSVNRRLIEENKRKAGVHEKIRNVNNSKAKTNERIKKANEDKAKIKEQLAIEKEDKKKRIEKIKLIRAKLEKVKKKEQILREQLAEEKENVAALKEQLGEQNKSDKKGFLFGKKK